VLLKIKQLMFIYIYIYVYIIMHKTDDDTVKASLFLSMILGLQNHYETKI